MMKEGYYDVQKVQKMALERHFVYGTVAVVPVDRMQTIRYCAE